MQIENKEPVPGSFLIIIGFKLLTGFVYLLNQHVRHLMIPKSKRYLFAYNEYCEVNLEGAFINIKLIIRNQESETGNWFLFFI